MPSKSGKKDATPPQKTTLKDVFAKQGVHVKIEAKMGDEGCPKNDDEMSWLEAEEKRLKDAVEERKSTLCKSVKELQQAGEFTPKAKIGGSFDKYGNPRKNVGGRPRKYQDPSWRNLSRRQRLQVKGVQREQRKEILGTLQKEMCERLNDLEEKYPLLSERPLFWQEAKKIVGDLSRDRVKKMRKRYTKICKMVERTKAGQTGAKKRGANRIDDALQDGYRSKAIRDSSTGAKWQWKTYEKKIKNG